MSEVYSIMLLLLFPKVGVQEVEILQIIRNYKCQVLCSFVCVGMCHYQRHDLLDLIPVVPYGTWVVHQSSPSPPVLGLLLKLSPRQASVLHFGFS